MDTVGPYRLLEMIRLYPAGRVWRAVDDQGTQVTLAVLEAPDPERDRRFRAAANGPVQGQVVNSDLTTRRPWVAFADDGGPGASQMFSVLPAGGRPGVPPPAPAGPVAQPPASFLVEGPPPAGPVSPQPPQVSGPPQPPPDPKETQMLPPPETVAPPVTSGGPAGTGGQVAAGPPVAAGAPNGYAGPPVAQNTWAPGEPPAGFSLPDQQPPQQQFSGPPAPQSAPPAQQFSGPPAQQPSGPPAPQSAPPAQQPSGPPAQYSGPPAQQPSGPPAQFSGPPAPQSAPPAQQFSGPPAQQPSGPPAQQPASPAPTGTFPVPQSAPPSTASGPPAAEQAYQNHPQYVPPQPYTPQPGYGLPAGYGPPPEPQSTPGQPPYGPPPQPTYSQPTVEQQQYADPQQYGQPAQQPYAGPPAGQPYVAQPYQSEQQPYPAEQAPWTQPVAPAGAWTPQPGPETEPPTTRLVPPPKPPKRRRGALITVFVIVLVLLLGAGTAGGYYLTQQDEDPNPTNTQAGDPTPTPTPTPKKTRGSAISEPAPTASPSEPGKEPLKDRPWPTDWAMFRDDDRATEMTDLAGLGFDFKVPTGWTCTNVNQYRNAATWSCGDKEQGSDKLGGEITVRDCAIPCDPARKIKMRRMQEAWGLQWLRPDGHTAYAETDTLTSPDGSKRYGIVLVRYWHSEQGGKLDKQLVVRLSGPLEKKADIQKVVTSIIAVVE